MIPVFQEHFYTEDEHGKPLTRGGCFIACIASILEVPYHGVPRFFEWYGVSNWRVHLDNWFNYYGLQIDKIDGEPWDGSDDYFIVSGPSPRFDGKIWHSCVWHKGEIVHDPHPDGTGLREYRRWQIIRKVFKY
jgi:hypothetical protein